MDASDVADLMEIQQLLARYAAGMTMDDAEVVLSVFAPGGTYSAFGDEYGTDAFLRRNGARDSGRPHDPRRPRPGRQLAG